MTELLTSLSAHRTQSRCAPLSVWLLDKQDPVPPFSIFFSLRSCAKLIARAIYATFKQKKTHKKNSFLLFQMLISLLQVATRESCTKTTTTVIPRQV